MVSAHSKKSTAAAALLVLVTLAATTSAQAPAQPEPEFVKQAQQLLREGKRDEALEVYRQTLERLPHSPRANVGAGNILDLMGRGEEARQYFQKAIDGAITQEDKASAKRAMAMSYAFEDNCAKTIEYEKQVFDYLAVKHSYFQAGEIANEAARVCLNTGDLDTAQKWYKTGTDTGLNDPGITAAGRDLWAFRWEHAQARLAVRRGQQAEAQKHVAAAKAILDKGAIPEQAQFFPYLTSYVAFYAGNYKAAVEDLKQANQNDPFIQCMIGQAYEQLGDKEKSMEYYRKALASTGHNPSAAYAVPFARKKLS